MEKTKKAITLEKIENKINSYIKTASDNTKDKMERAESLYFLIKTATLINDNQKIFEKYANLNEDFVIQELSEMDMEKIAISLKGMFRGFKDIFKTPSGVWRNLFKTKQVGPAVADSILKRTDVQALRGSKAVGKDIKNIFRKIKGTKGTSSATTGGGRVSITGGGSKSRPIIPPELKEKGKKFDWRDLIGQKGQPVGEWWKGLPAGVRATAGGAGGLAGLGFARDILTGNEKKYNQPGGGGGSRIVVAEDVDKKEDEFTRMLKAIKKENEKDYKVTEKKQKYNIKGGIKRMEKDKKDEKTASILKAVIMEV